MEPVFLFLLSIISLIFGCILTLLVQWYLLNSYIIKGDEGKKPSSVNSINLPKDLLEDIGSGREPAKALNGLLQFLFQECRNTKGVRRWFWRRLSQEMDDLRRTTAGILFDNITLRDINLGSHFPSIDSIEVRKLTLDPETKLIEDLDICLDLNYAGGFEITLDASVRLSKPARVSVRVNELSGKAMMRLTRNPYTHWCFSFYEEPLLKLSVETQISSRFAQQVNSIITSQIRKTLRKKHTLPHYKIRYKPFFIRRDLEVPDADETEEPNPGTLEVTIVEVTRLIEAEGPIFCSAAIDKLAWIEMTASETSGYLIIDVNVAKQHGLSTVFKQEFIPDKYQVGVVVETVLSGSELKPGDIIVMVDGKNINSLNALHKTIKSTSQPCLRFKVERKTKSCVINDDKLPETFGLRHRNSSAQISSPDNKTDSDSSNLSSTSDSPIRRGSPSHGAKINTVEHEVDPDLPQVSTTSELAFTKVITFNETLKFQVFPEHRYLNLSVWSHGPTKNILLGHIGLPLRPFCGVKASADWTSVFTLLPPSLNPRSGDNVSSHPGHEPCLCYGDVLVSVSFSPSTSVPVSPCSAPAPPVTPLPPVTITTASNTPAPSPTTETPGEHDFVRRNFDKFTQCGFCFKKIWLKDALQCQGCMMSCHKKCAPKCQAVSTCAKSTTHRPSQPEIHLSSVPAEEAQSGRTLSTLLSSVTPRNLKRAGSATNLAPPGMETTATGSISLPPSPNHSPSPSRKTSLADGGLFLSSDGGDDEIEQAVEILLSRPPDENLMDTAKASGKLLFADLPPEARERRINNVMTKLKEALDAELLSNSKLLSDEQLADNPAAKAKLAFLLGKSDEKIQALTVLILHCCAALQDYQETLN